MSALAVVCQPLLEPISTFFPGFLPIWSVSAIPMFLFCLFSLGFAQRCEPPAHLSIWHRKPTCAGPWPWCGACRASPAWGSQEPTQAPPLGPLQSGTRAGLAATAAGAHLLSTGSAWCCAPARARTSAWPGWRRPLPSLGTWWWTGLWTEDAGVTPLATAPPRRLPGSPLLSSLHSLGSDAGLPPPLLAGPVRAVVGQSWRDGRTDQSPSWPSVKSPARIPPAPGAWVSFSFVLLQSLWRLGARRVPTLPGASLSVPGCICCLFLLLFRWTGQRPLIFSLAYQTFPRCWALGRKMTLCRVPCL